MAAGGLAPECGIINEAVKSSLVLLAVGVLLALVVFVNDPGRAASLAVSASDSAPSAPASTPAAAPEAENDAAAGQLVLQRCGGCHALDRLRQNPQDEAGWTHTVQLMEQMGAQVAPQEEPVIVRYLARHFGK